MWNSHTDHWARPQTVSTVLRSRMRMCAVTPDTTGGITCLAVTDAVCLRVVRKPTVRKKRYNRNMENLSKAGSAQREVFQPPTSTSNACFGHSGTACLGKTRCAQNKNEQAGHFTAIEWIKTSTGNTGTKTGSKKTQKSCDFHVFS